MRCHVCNTVLEPDEVIHDNTFVGGFKPCSKCLEEIGEVFEDYIEEDDEEDGNDTGFVSFNDTME